MYQEKTIMGAPTFNNGYEYPSPWNHSPVKQEQDVDYYGYNNNTISPIPSYHSAIISTTPDGYYTAQNNMCHPLMVDDYASSISSPDGPLLSPTSPADVLSSPSPTSEDQWFGLYSPTVTLQHTSPPPYFVEQRHSFDESMFFNNVSKPCLDNSVVESTCCLYPCNSNYAPTMYQQQSITARHQSMPTLYQQQHRYSPTNTTATDVRPYQCQICDRTFARKHDLQRHIRVHTGDKPYACLCCKKAFARTDALKRHLRMEEICRSSPQIQAMKSSGKRRYKNL